MGFEKTELKVPCYIGETRFKAGIFLALDIAKRKAYADSLRFSKFSNYAEAKTVFMNTYEAFIEDDFRPNRLYEVRSRKIYSVFSTPYFVGIVETEKSETLDYSKLTKETEKIRWQDYLQYEDAIKIAREKFVRIWRNHNFYIYQNIPLNTVIWLSDVKKENNID